MKNDLSSSGIEGLDEVLQGGFLSRRMYLVEGDPGVGKTTLSLQFLLEGAKRGEQCLYIALSESKEELESAAASHGWDLSQLRIIELSAINDALGEKSQNSLFNAADIELNELLKLVTQTIEKYKPHRIVLDSLSELRMLSQSPIRYRRQILSLKQLFLVHRATVLVLDDLTDPETGRQIHSIAHGIVSLKSFVLKYGIIRRNISISKLRGTKFLEGFHDYTIRKGGLAVFPRLVAGGTAKVFEKKFLKSGNAPLDQLMGGGLHTGTSNLLMGPAGTGKSTIASMFVNNHCQNSDKALYLTFDENITTLKNRANELGISLEPHIQRGHLDIVQIDPANLSPGELSKQVVEAVEIKNISLIVIDSLNGYVNAMPQEDFIYLHLHELLTYLSQQGVMTLMVMTQHGLVGNMGSPVDVSYLADSVILLRFFEAFGTLKKAISVVKKRSGKHEASIREVVTETNSITIGQPLLDFQGILSGIPNYVGNREKMLKSDK